MDSNPYQSPEQFDEDLPPNTNLRTADFAIFGGLLGVCCSFLAMPIAVGLLANFMDVGEKANRVFFIVPIVCLVSCALLGVILGIARSRRSGN